MLDYFFVREMVAQGCDTLSGLVEGRESRNRRDRPTGKQQPANVARPTAKLNSLSCCLQEEKKILRAGTTFGRIRAALPLGSYPLGSPADAAGIDEPLVFQFSQHEWNSLIAHSRHGSPHVRHLERCSSVVEHVVSHPILLGDPRTVIGRPCCEGLIRIGDHLDKESQPGPRVMRPVLPASSRSRKGFVVRIAALVDETFEGDVPTDAVADLGKQTGAEQAKEPPVAVDKRVDREEIEREQPDEKSPVIVTSSLFSPIPIYELGHEVGRVLVRGWDEPNTRRPVGVPVHDEVVDVLELSPSATGPTKEKSVEMKDKSRGQPARIVLEQVVEGITTRDSAFGTRRSWPGIVGTSDDPFGSGCSTTIPSIAEEAITDSTLAASAISFSSPGN